MTRQVPKDYWTRQFRLDAKAWKTLEYFLVLAAFILIVVVLIIVFKGLRAGTGG